MNSVLKRLTNKLLDTANKAVDGLVFTEKDSHEELLKYQDVISKQFVYFTELTTLEKERFLERVYHFRKSKKFHYTGLDTNPEIEILISACAVQITFGLRKYRMPFFRDIFVMADQYHFGFNQQDWVGHVNRTGIYYHGSIFCMVITAIMINTM